MPRNQYVFYHNGFIPAPIDDVWYALADIARLPEWWGPVFREAQPLDGDGQGEPRVGARFRCTVRGFLPYYLRCIMQIEELTRPTVVAIRETGDLNGWLRVRLSEDAGGTRTSVENRVSADRPLLRVLSPLVKPLLAHNHNWCFARADPQLTAYLAGRVDRMGRAAE